MSNLLALEKVSKKFTSAGGELAILNNVDLVLEAGTSTAIVGPSGSGKSTLLHIMGLLDKPTHGKVLFEGKSVARAADRVRAHLRSEAFGFVYQYHHLLPEFTALENVLMPAIIAGKGNARAKQRATELLALVGLEQRLKHFPAQLSGGEQQRVAIARALMNKPRLLLADEPTGNLDPASAKAVSKLLHDLTRGDNGLALVLVTHNKDLAKSCHSLYQVQGGGLVKK